MVDSKDIIILLLAAFVIGLLVGKGGATSIRSYKNTEEWEFIRDDEGRTLGVRVHRRAKEN